MMYNALEQVKDATTPDEMRAEIFRLQHYDPLVRRVTDMAIHTGMNAEDRYTVLAYHALRSKNEAQATALNLARCNPMPRIADGWNVSYGQAGDWLIETAESLKAAA